MNRGFIGALCCSVTFALLAGCGGSQLPIGAPGAARQLYANRSKHNTSIVETVIYSFRGGSGSMGDGAVPQAALIDVGGTLYGTTSLGGFYNHRFDRYGRGTVFSVTPSGKEIVLYRFTGRNGDQFPDAGLLKVNDVMYGTTQGNDRKLGTVFSISPNGAESVLHRFNGSNGAAPQAGLIQVNGLLYGTTEAGGKSGCGGYGCGTVFTITPTGKEHVLHSFGSNGDGSGPPAAVVDVKGTLYGTTTEGGAEGDGIVFAITRSGKETILHSFDGGTSDGSEPSAGLINVNGTLYGTTAEGGAYGGGTVFSITPTGSEGLLHSFGTEGDGAQPQAGLVNVNGILYGTTYAGGAKGNGTVFSVTRSGTETVFYSFSTNYQDGTRPRAGLINVNGTLYGTTAAGGATDNGTVYSLTGI